MILPGGRFQVFVATRPVDFRKGYRVGRAGGRQRHGVVRRRRDGCLPRLSAEPPELRRRGFDRVILSTFADRPWSQYFCCMIYGNRAWVRDPVATKRFLRAVFNAAEFCQAEPETAARRLVDGGFAPRYDYALETVRKLPYDLWHEYDWEDSLRFCALRLHEAGMITSSPNPLLAEGTDWRFVNELKHELKA